MGFYRFSSPRQRRSDASMKTLTVVTICGILELSVSCLSCLSVPNAAAGDLDKFATRILSCGEELSSDHPGFNDKTYLERCVVASKLALTQDKAVHTLLRLRLSTSMALLFHEWNTLRRKLPHGALTDCDDDQLCATGARSLVSSPSCTPPTHARSITECFPSSLVPCGGSRVTLTSWSENCGYRVDNIPQLGENNHTSIQVY